jgi:hypothetical protein
MLKTQLTLKFNRYLTSSRALSVDITNRSEYDKAVVDLLPESRRTTAQISYEASDIEHY